MTKAKKKATKKKAAPKRAVKNISDEEFLRSELDQAQAKVTELAGDKASLVKKCTELELAVSKLEDAASALQVRVDKARGSEFYIAKNSNGCLCIMGMPDIPTGDLSFYAVHVHKRIDLYESAVRCIHDASTSEKASKAIAEELKSGPVSPTLTKMKDRVIEILMNQKNKKGLN